MITQEIDELDSAILAALDLNCRTSTVELAKTLNRSRQTIDYRIERLEDRAIIQNYHTTVNYSRIGFRKYKIFLRLRNLPDRKKEFREFLYSLGNVYWIGESSGSWDILIGLFYRQELEIASVGNQLVSAYEDLIVARFGQIIVSIDQFPKAYFNGETKPSRALLGSVVQHELDRQDYNLLAELIQDAKTPAAQLAEKFGTSLASVQKRMKRLEEAGIIVQYRIGVDLCKVGLQLYKVIFDLWSYGDEEHRQLLAYVSTRPEIQYVVRNIWTIELEIIVSDYRQVQALIDDIRKHFPRLSSAVDTLLLDSDEWTSALTNIIRNRGVEQRIRD